MVNEYWTEWITPSGSNKHNLLKDNIVNYLNIDRNNIASIETFISLRTEPFIVTGLASPKHPLCVSGGIRLIMNDGSACMVEELYYTDLTKHWWYYISGNTNKRHFNSESRITKSDGNSEIFNGQHDPYNIVDDHIFRHAKYIEYNLPTPSGQTDQPKSKKIFIEEELKKI